MTWLLHFIGLNSGSGTGYLFWSGVGDAGLVIGALAAVGKLIHSHLKHARRQTRILADLYKHHTGKTHPDAPESQH